MISKYRLLYNDPILFMTTINIIVNNSQVSLPVDNVIYYGDVLAYSFVMY